MGRRDCSPIPIAVTNERTSREPGHGNANLVATASPSAAAAHEVETRVQRIVDGLQASDGIACERREQLQRAIHPQAMPRLGELLVARGLITTADLDHGLQAQRSSGKLLGDTLVNIGLISSVAL